MTNTSTNSGASSRKLTILTGASRGMGLAIAQALVARGEALVCISRRVNEELTAASARSGAVLEQWSCDLAQPADAAKRVGEWLAAQDGSAWDTVTLLNNAGVLPRIAPMSELDVSDITHAMRVGLEAPMALTSAFLKATKDWSVKRRVLNISSGLGRRAMASQASYCAAKAGMDHFTRCLALEEALQSNGAKVCSLAPGVIDTDMQIHLRAADESAFPDIQGFVNLKAQGMLASPADAARSVLAFLDKPGFGDNPVADVREG